MPALSTLQHSHFLFLLVLFSDLFITVFAQLFLVFNLHILIISLSSFSFIFAHELIYVINIDLLLLITHELISRVDLHVCIIYLLFFLELCFLLTHATNFLLLFGIGTSSLGDISVEYDFHVVNFKLVWFLHKARESLNIWRISIMLHKFAFVGMSLEFYWLTQEFSATTFKFTSLTQWWII